jgi:4,5-dihydroxyphthalate decarboxylase
MLTKDTGRVLQTARRNECDLAEFNVVGYFADSEDDTDLFALPVFPHRRFRLGFIFVNTAAGIREPRDLIGRTIVVRGERPAAVVWLRGILNEYFGVPYDEVRLVDTFGLLGERPESYDGGPRLGRAHIDEMLLNGTVDAMLSTSLPPAFLVGDPRIARLFADFNDRDVEYYRRTNIFPIMHALTIRRSLIERAPWAPTNLLRAFTESKNLAYARMRNPRIMPLAFFQRAWEDQLAILGPDPWVYGMNEVNRNNLATILRYAGEQGLLKTDRTIDDLFIGLDDATLERFQE